MRSGRRTPRRSAAARRRAIRKELPRFRSEAEEVRFWETHCVADYWDQLKPSGGRVRKGNRTAARRGTKRRAPAPRTVRLADLVARVTPRNRHPETDWGRPVGREIL